MVPLLVQNTIFNTAPFWASILGWLFNRERITNFEILALILSFVGVLCISFSGYNKDDDSSTAVVTEDGIPGSHLIGSGLIFITSWCYAFVSILTRRMQKVNFAVMLFYYSAVAFFITLIMILGEVLVNGSEIRIFAYSGEQFGWILLVCFVNYLGLNCNTIAL